MKKLLEENSIKVIELQILEKSENSKMNIKEKVTALKRKYTQAFICDVIDEAINKSNNNLPNSKKLKIDLIVCLKVYKQVHKENLKKASNSDTINDRD